jgi:hypothetical protein
MKNTLFSLLFGLFSFAALAQIEIQEKRRNFQNLKVKKWQDLVPDIKLSKNQPLKEAKVLEIKESFISNIYLNEPAELSIAIPTLGVFTFERVEIFSPDFYVETSDGKRYSDKEAKGVHYQSTTGIGGISFFADRLMAVISANGTQYNIGKSADGKSYILVSEQSLPPNPFLCNNQDEEFKTGYHREAEKSASFVSASCKVTRIAFEADYDLYLKSGSNVATTSNFVSGLFNVVKKLFLKESIAMQFSHLFVWTTPDPYANTSNGAQILVNFTSNRPKQPNWDLIHFLDNRTNSLGGMAWIGCLCSASPHAFSSIYSSYNSLPVFSWSVFCVAHELGHNFGSRHTHWCGWNLPNGTVGRIDSCYAGEGSCGNNTKFNMKGTIMSYCYNNGAVDFNLGFGPLPGKVIRDFVSAAACLPVVSSSLCDSLTVVVPPQPSGQCVTGLMHYTNASGQSCFRFNIRPGCRYTLNYCRYDGYSQANQPPAGLVPSACGVRNGISNYLPTATQLAAGKIDLVANAQPMLRQKWYSLRCQGSDGVTQLHFFWWP